MPIGNDSYVNNTLEILKAFLFSSYPIYKRKNIISGYGLKKEDLNKKPYEGFNKTGSKKHNASSKMFSKRKDSLIYDYHIVSLPSNERGKFYGITPIGISYFCQNIEELDSNTFASIISHLRSWYDKDKPESEKSYMKELDKVLKKIPENNTIVDRTFQEILSNLQIEEDLDAGSFLRIGMNYRPTLGLDVLLTRLVYFRDSETNETYSLDFDSKNNPNFEFEKYLDVNKFNYYISKFIIRAFLHSLYSMSSMVCDNLKDMPKSEMPKLMKEEFEVHQSILDSFKGKIVIIVNEFHDEVIKAIQLQTTHLKLQGL